MPKKSVKLFNVNINKIIASDIYIADNFFTRFTGLLNKTELPTDTGLWIIPCNSIHTIGMKFNIDVIFLNKENTVVHLMEDVKPYRLSPIIISAHSVVELLPGTIKNTGTQTGHQIEIKYTGT